MTGATLVGGENLTGRLREYGEVLVVVGIVFVVGLLVLPLPTILLDVFLAMSLGSSLLVLLVTLNLERPLDFSSFPAVLLLLTLYRLALNVSSTRLILGQGEAGRVIEAFGEFVIGGNYAVGVVIFLILVGINFIVITKGAGRVAEVAARFTLDAMPGRQMSIDGDLNAGLIDDREAKTRREEVAREADFYGAMDGAAKFVRGDAIAGLLITAINILGGLFIGMVQRGMSVGSALSEYTILTVGDGLVTQIPALVVSTAAGIMVTSSSGGDRLGEAVLSQLGRRQKPIWIAAGFLGVLGLVPGLPLIPFLALSSGAGLIAYFGVEEDVSDEVEALEGRSEEDRRGDLESPVQELVQIDPAELEVGFGLIPLIDEEQGGDLMERIRLLRKQAANELGILIPQIRIRDDLNLPSEGYRIKIRGTEVAVGTIIPDRIMALDIEGTGEELEGIQTMDPSFGMPAVWITPDRRMAAESRGYAVVEPSTVLATHLMETLKENAAQLLSRQDVREMLDALEESYPAMVDDVVPERVSLGLLHRVLRRLLAEKVPIRDLVTILEALADTAEDTSDPEVLTEHVRRALSQVIGDLYASDEGVVEGVTLGPRLETALMSLFSPESVQAGGGIVEPDTLTELLGQLEELTRSQGESADPVPVVTPPNLRVGVRRLIEPVLPSVPVISLAELPPRANINSVATWELNDAA